MQGDAESMYSPAAAASVDSGEIAVDVRTRLSQPPTESAGVFPSKQQQNDEAVAPLDDQERRAVEKRLQRKADERRAQLDVSGRRTNSV